MKIGTLFSGGLAAPEFALKYLNMDHEVIFACEWDKYARQQYLHFHGEPQTFYNDVSDMDGTPYKNKIDLMVWGSPCQDLSLAGKRKGFDGVKSSLFREGARIMSEVMPKYFIFENVKGLLSSNGGADYKEVIKTFQEMGYKIVSDVLNTKDFSIPQNRERVFIVGFLNDADYQTFNMPQKEPLKLRLKDILEENVAEKYYLSKKMVDGFISKNNNPDNKMTIQAFHSKDDDYCNTLTARYFKMGITDPYIKEEGYINQDTQASKVIGVEGISPTLNAGTHGYAQGYLREPRLTQVGYIKNNSQGQRVYDTQCCVTLSSLGGGMGAKTGLYQIGAIRGRNPDNPKSRTAGLPTQQMLEINENGVTNCLTSVQKDNVVVEVDQYRIRRLTPKECFKLQGLKDEDIDLVVSDTQAYKIAGNAITVQPMMRLIDNIVSPKNYGTLF